MFLLNLTAVPKGSGVPSPSQSILPNDFSRVRSFAVYPTTVLAQPASATYKGHYSTHCISYRKDPVALQWWHTSRRQNTWIPIWGWTSAKPLEWAPACILHSWAYVSFLTVSAHPITISVPSILVAPIEIELLSFKGS